MSYRSTCDPLQQHEPSGLRRRVLLFPHVIISVATMTYRIREENAGQTEEGRQMERPSSLWKTQLAFTCKQE